MSGSKKRGKAAAAAAAGAERSSSSSSRSTQSSVNKRTSESVDKEKVLLMCSCGFARPSKEEEISWKEDSVEAAEKKGVSETNEKAEKAKDTAATAALAMIPERAAIIEQARPPKEDSESEEKIQSPENSFDDESVVEAAEQQERMNSTSFSQENYRTPLLSPDLWPQQDVDEMIHQHLQKITTFDSSSLRDDEKCSDRGGIFVHQEIEPSAVEGVNANDEYRPPGAVKEPQQQQQRQQHPSIVAAELEPAAAAAAATPNYDRLTADMLISVIESHRDALNDQKVLLAQQTDAINRLASAVERQTKIISTLNENKLPIHN